MNLLTLNKSDLMCIYIICIISKQACRVALSSNTSYYFRCQDYIILGQNKTGQYLYKEGAENRHHITIKEKTRRGKRCQK